MTESTADVDVSEAPGLGVPSWILLCTVAIVPVVFATGFSRFGAIKEYAMSAGIGVALLFWAVSVARRGRLAFAAWRVVSLAVAAAFFVVLSVAWGPEALYSGVSAVHLVALVAVVLILSAPIGRPMRFDEFALAVAAGTAAAALTGLADLAGLGIFTIVWNPPGPTGAFDAMEFAAAYYAVALPVVVAGVDYTSDWRRIFFGVAALLGAAHFGLVATWTFVALLAGACAAVAILVVVTEGVETVTVLTPIAGLVGLVLLVNVVASTSLSVADERTDANSLPVMEGPSGLSTEMVEEKQPRNPAFSIGRIESVRSMEERAYLAAVSFDLFQDQPLIGHGPGSWWRLQTRYANMDHPAAKQRFRHYPAYRSPHSAWSKFAVEYGVIGTALFVLWILGCAGIALGAMGRSGEHADLIVEQWALWASALAGLLFATFTPLLELAPAALIWFAAVGLLTRRSAEINEYRGSSKSWEFGRDGGAGVAGRGGMAASAGLVAVAILTLASFDVVSGLYRGWGDQLMLRTYYNRAIEQYERADEWLPIRGGVVYNQALAQSRLGVLTRNLPAETRFHRSTGDSETSGAALGIEEQSERWADAGSEVRTDAGRGSTEDDGADSTEGSESDDAESAENSGEESRSGLTAGSKLEAPGLELIQRAVEMRPYDSRVLDLIAAYYVKSDFSQKALGYARRAVDANRNNIKARKTFATALQTLGKLDEAAKQLNAILERNPPKSDRYTVHFHLGRLYFSGLEEFEHARKHLNAAINAAENPQAAEKAREKLAEVEKRAEQQRRLREGKPPKQMEEEAPSPDRLEELQEQFDEQKEGGHED